MVFFVPFYIMILVSFEVCAFFVLFCAFLWFFLISVVLFLCFCGFFCGLVSWFSDDSESSSGSQSEKPNFSCAFFVLLTGET